MTLTRDTARRIQTATLALINSPLDESGAVITTYADVLFLPEAAQFHDHVRQRFPESMVLIEMQLDLLDRCRGNDVWRVVAEYAPLERLLAQIVQLRDPSKLWLRAARVVELCWEAHDRVRAGRPWPLPRICGWLYYTLAEALLQSQEGSHCENVESAINLLAMCLNSISPISVFQQYGVRRLLGVAYQARTIGWPAENRALARQNLEAALDFSPPHLLPFLHLELISCGPNSHHWIDYHAGKALEWFTLNLPQYHALTRLRALEARIELCRRDELATLLNDYRVAAALLPRECVVETVKVHLRLARATGDDVEVCAREAATALDLLDKPLDPFDKQLPRERRTALGILGAASLARGDAETALRSFDEACLLSEALFDTACIVPSLRIEAVATDELHLGAASCLLRLRRYDEALLRSERGRSRVLADDLFGAATDASGPYHAWLQSVRRIGYSSYEYMADAFVTARAAIERAAFVQERRRARDHEFALSDVRALVPQGGALVVMLEYDSATNAVIVTRQTETLSEVNLVPLSCRVPDLWAGVMGPIFARLVQLGVPLGGHVILVPMGGTRDAALHAASRQVEGRSRPFLMDYTVSYAMSLVQLRASQRRAAERADHPPSLTVVCNPTNDLPHALSEGVAIAALFPESARYVYGVGLDRMSVLSRATTTSYVHFACHASLAGDPDDAALHLGDLTPMTIGVIRDFCYFERARLVTLSACTTGTSTPPELASEQIGMVETMLRAGAAAIVASMWPVDDLATCLLMEQFYRHLVESRLDPPAALRAAQLWLREQTPDVVAPSSVRDINSPGRTATEPRYSDPYYWAGFRCIGV